MLAPRGTLVIVGGEGGGAVTRMGRQLDAESCRLRSTEAHIVNRERQSDLEQLADLADAGTLKAAVGTVYPLDQAADAVKHLVGGHAKGKIAITLDRSDRV